jgi:heme-degrading monooxygenase HmoA
MMILEIAILDVRPGEAEAFEADFRKAQALVAQTPGYQRHSLSRCVENSDRYLLQIWWDTLEAHTEGFRGSPQYALWRELLHHYYDPFPTVEHYESVDL